MYIRCTNTFTAKVGYGHLRVHERLSNNLESKWSPWLKSVGYSSTTDQHYKLLKDLLKIETLKEEHTVLYRLRYLKGKSFISTELKYCRNKMCKSKGANTLSSKKIKYFVFTRGKIFI